MTPELTLIGILWGFITGRMITLGPRVDSLTWMPKFPATHWYRINAIPAQFPFDYIQKLLLLHILCCFILLAHSSRITYILGCVHLALFVAWAPLFFHRARSFKVTMGILLISLTCAVFTFNIAAIPAIIVMLWPTIMNIQLVRENPIIIDEVPYISRVPREVHEV